MFDSPVYVPEVQSNTFSKHPFVDQVIIDTVTPDTLVFKLPADKKKAYEVEYFLVFSSIAGVRSGTMEIVVDPETTPATGTTSLADEYSYTGSSVFADSVDFYSKLTDRNGDSLVDTLEVRVLNSNQTGTLYFRVKTKS